MLSDRRQQILCALIEEYVERALPVGSKTLTDRYPLGVSSATIRNELSVLEEAGYILQPHTSAGRIPTDFGYRAFVDHLLQLEELKDDAVARTAIDEVRAHASEVDDLLEKTSAALARLTDCLAIVLAPSVLKCRLKQLSLISFTEYHILIIAVTEEGQVFDRHVDLPMPISPDHLAVIQNQLNEMLLGKTLDEVESGLGRGVKQVISDTRMRCIFAETLKCLQVSQTQRPHRLGLPALLSQPEFANAQTILPVIEVLEDETVLLELVDDALNSAADPLVRIGSENASEGLRGVSVVASPYGHGESAGIVAVIGPKRMDYSKAIAAVRAARSNLMEL